MRGEDLDKGIKRKGCADIKAVVGEIYRGLLLLAVYEFDGLDTLKEDDGRSIIRTCSIIPESEWASQLCFGVMIV